MGEKVRASMPGTPSAPINAALPVFRLTEYSSLGLIAYAASFRGSMARSQRTVPLEPMSTALGAVE